MRKVLLDSSEAETLIQLLQKSKDKRTPGMIQTIREKLEDSELMERCQELAEEKHLSDEGDIEVDNDTVISLSEDNKGVRGAYVMAWTYVELSVEDRKHFGIPLQEYEEDEEEEPASAK